MKSSFVQFKSMRIRAFRAYGRKLLLPFNISVEMLHLILKDHIKGDKVMEQRLFELLDGLVKYNTESPPGRNTDPLQDDIELLKNTKF